MAERREARTTAGAGKGKARRERARQAAISQKGSRKLPRARASRAVGDSVEYAAYQAKEQENTPGRGEGASWMRKESEEVGKKKSEGTGH